MKETLDDEEPLDIMIATAAENYESEMNDREFQAGQSALHNMPTCYTLPHIEEVEREENTHDILFVDSHIPAAGREGIYKSNSHKIWQKIIQNHSAIQVWKTFYILQKIRNYPTCTQIRNRTEKSRNSRKVYW